MRYKVGDVVVRGDGREGVVVGMDERELVVRYGATGVVRLSPWGEYVDAGETGHHFWAFPTRLPVIRVETCEDDDA